LKHPDGENAARPIRQAQGNHFAACEVLMQTTRENRMLGTILIIVLILLLIGSFPSWPYSSGWGYGPSGLLGTVLVVLLILVLIGRI
jgi:Protein of unknown function (DUF3309)